MTQEPELPALTEAQLDVLRRFASFDTGIDELRSSLAGVFEFDLAPRQAAGGLIAAQDRHRPLSHS